MKIRMMRDAGGKAAGTVHDLTPWAAKNFIRMGAAKLVCERCGTAPQNIDNHPCAPAQEMPAALNRMMPKGTVR